MAVEYWTALAKVMPDWKKVKDGDLKAAELRQEKINTHAVIMRALGGMGRALMTAHPKDWKKRLEALKDVDWRKSAGSGVNPIWDNVCISAGSVVSNRQARAATLALLKKLVSLDSASDNGKVAPTKKSPPLGADRQTPSRRRVRGHHQATELIEVAKPRPSCAPLTQVERQSPLTM